MEKCFLKPVIIYPACRTVPINPWSDQCLGLKISRYLIESVECFDCFFFFNSPCLKPRRIWLSFKGQGLGFEDVRKIEWYSLKSFFVLIMDVLYVIPPQHAAWCFSALFFMSGLPLLELCFSAPNPCWNLITTALFYLNGSREGREGGTRMRQQREAHLKLSFPCEAQMVFFFYQCQRSLLSALMNRF